MFVLFGLMLAGGLGGVSRFLLGKWFAEKALRRNSCLFLTPMLLVNWLGSLGLGLTQGAQQFFPTALILSVSVGFWGTFTTFSAFSVEAVTLLRARRFVAALIYLLATFGGALVGYWIGWNAALGVAP